MAKSSRWNWKIFFLALVIVLVVARVAAPFGLQALVNQRLRGIPEYTGEVGAIHLSVFRGAYQLRNVRIVKRDGDPKEPFVAAKLIDFSLAWRKLFAGQLVSDIYVENATVTFLNSSTSGASQLETDQRWQDVIQDLFPIEITRCQINGGVLRYVDTARTPKVDISIRDLQVRATGLRNRPAKDGEAFPSTVLVEGTVLGSGHLSVNAQLDPLALKPHFQGKINLTKVELTQLDNFLRAYGHVDVSSGQLQVYLEAKAQEGAFDGYVKPFFENLKFTNDNIQNDNVGKRIWQGLISAVAKLVKNHERDQVATQIPFSGRFDDPKVGVLATIGNLFRNGFGEALSEGFNSEKAKDQKTDKLSESKG